MSSGRDKDTLYDEHTNALKVRILYIETASDIQGSRKCILIFTSLLERGGEGWGEGKEREELNEREIGGGENGYGKETELMADDEIRD